MALTPSSSSTRDTTYPTVDLALARRLERAEGMASAACVDARRDLEPGAGAEWMEVAGALAMFDGAASPLTQTFGLGVSDSFTALHLDQIEQFYFSRESPVSHELSSFVAPSILNLLSARGYSPIEASAVLVRPTATLPGPDTGRVAVRVGTEAEAAIWARVAGEGWSSESPELAAFVEDFGRIVARARGAHCFLAELDGEPIAAAGLNISNGIALLAGASTIPRARRQGAQLALLQARLGFAAARGITLAMIVTQPGSPSQRNARREGFRPVYTRSKWHREPARQVPGPPDVS